MWVALSVLGTLICGVVWYFFARDPWLVVGFGVELASIVLAYVMGWQVLPSSTKIAADRYAESMLGSFLMGANTNGD